MKSEVDLSIIIPAYKEAEIIGSSLERIAEYLENHNQLDNTEILVVSNCPEDTAQAAVKKADLFPHFVVFDEHDRMGKGGAVRLGMFEASGDYRLFMDTDLATPLHHLEQMFELISQNVEVAIGVRDLVAIHDGLLRKIVTKTANIGAQIFATPGIKDTQCGFKMFRADVAEQVFGRQIITGWSFDVEILAIARQLGYKIHTLGLPDWEDPKSEGLVGDSPLQIVFNEALSLFKIRWRLLTGTYKQLNYQHQTQLANVCYPKERAA